MEDVGIWIDRIETPKGREGQALHRIVVFIVHAEDVEFDIAIKLNLDIEDEDLVQEARLKLNQILIGMQYRMQVLLRQAG